jgi:hypothetical protein
MASCGVPATAVQQIQERQMQIPEAGEVVAVMVTMLLRALVEIAGPRFKVMPVLRQTVERLLITATQYICHL